MPIRRLQPASFNISEVDFDSSWAMRSASDKMEAAMSSHCEVFGDMDSPAQLMCIELFPIVIANCQWLSYRILILFGYGCCGVGAGVVGVGWSV